MRPAAASSAWRSAPITRPRTAPGLAKAHLGLGRVDVDVDRLGRELEEQHRDRLAVVEQEIAVGGAQGALEQAVLDRPAVDVEVLEARAVAARGRQAGEGQQAHAVALGAHGERIRRELAAHHLAEARGEPRLAVARRGLEAQRAAAVDRELEGDRRVRQREAQDGLAHGLALGALGLEELEARRRREEQVAHLDAGAGGAGRGHRPGRRTALDREQERAVLARGPRAQREAADAGDRRQRLAAKAERPDPQQVVVRELRGGVALDRERELVRGHAAAVVGDRDQRLAAAGELDRDPPRAGVERVLDQLLDRRGRPLDHLARGDAVDQMLGQAADRGHDNLGAAAQGGAISGPACLDGPAASTISEGAGEPSLAARPRACAPPPIVVRSALPWPYARCSPLSSLALLAGLPAAAGAQAPPPGGGEGPARHGPHHPGPPPLLTVDDYLNCVRGCTQIFGAVEGAGAGLECIRGCRWTSSRETLPPEPAAQ